jgi:hypothetical protein
MLFSKKGLLDSIPKQKKLLVGAEEKNGCYNTHKSGPPGPIF